MVFVTITSIESHQQKVIKLPIAWSPKVTKCYKCNIIIGDFHRCKRIWMKCLQANYPLRFVDNIRNFQSTVNAGECRRLPYFSRKAYFMKIKLSFCERMKISLNILPKSSTIQQMENIIFDKMDCKEIKEFKRLKQKKRQNSCDIFSIKR